MSARNPNPHDTAWTYAAIAFGLVLCVAAAVAHAIGWHRYCDHRPRWHGYRPPGAS